MLQMIERTSSQHEQQRVQQAALQQAQHEAAKAAKAERAALTRLADSEKVSLTSLLLRGMLAVQTGCYLKVPHLWYMG